MTDRDLAFALRSSHRPPDSYARLFDAYGDEVYRECRASLGDAEAAQTVLRETLIVARAHADRLGDGSRLREWLIAVARAECERHRPTFESGAATDAPEEGAALPDHVRLRVLSGATCPGLSEYRKHIADRANAFDRRGFPVPLSRQRRSSALCYLLPGLVVAVCALLLLVLACYVCFYVAPE